MDESLPSHHHVVGLARAREHSPTAEQQVQLGRLADLLPDGGVPVQERQDRVGDR
jgi:hypothetical protein